MAENMKINHHQFTMDDFDKQRIWQERKRHFKDYCVNRYQWFKYPEWQYIAPFPLHVDFEASYHCNLKCEMCFRPHIENKDYGHMDFELYKKGIDECVENGLYSIRLSWRGESTLNPRLVDMIRYAKEKGIKEVSMISNGSQFKKEKLAREVIEAGLDYLTISVDGLEDHYNKTRHPLNYRKTIETIRKFYELKNKIGNGYPMLKVQGIWIYLKSNPNQYYNDFKDITDSICFGPENDYSIEEVKKIPDFVCQYPWQRISITWNGEVPLCIGDWGQNNTIGDFKKETIKQIWLGENMTKVRELHSSSHYLELKACQRCHRPETVQIGNKVEGK
ncbi:MAG: radical SAM protein [gamma proteobacterium symbiont of Taylorina sp.]|nr:radical SAM protein [gamma proteobacterium symbiont of Taylorina sp.]